MSGIKGSVYGMARGLAKKTGRAVNKQTASTRHPSSPKGDSYRKKPTATSMAPNAKNKRKSYGRAIPETAAEERKRKGA